MKASELLKKYGSPLYVYDEAIIRSSCLDMKSFQDSLEKKLNNRVMVRMHYSTKANSNPTILRIVKESCLNVDCMSPFEIAANELCGYVASQMLYVCNNISAQEMEHVHDKGILICLDSVSQVETWGERFPNTDIMVRINPGTIGVGHSKKVITSGKDTKFGISENNFGKLFEVAQKYNLNIIGIHQHLGSLFLNDKISEYLAGVRAGLNLIKKYFKNIQIVDLGGGFGIPYKFGEEMLDLKKLASDLSFILDNFISDYPSIREFKFEPGRYIPCYAGELIGTVTAVKKENGIWWIGTDIGMNQLVRPSMYDSHHEVSFPETCSDTPTITANICGNICESGDILAKERIVPLPKVGDPIIVHHAGAYGYSMASNYTGRPRPAEVLVSSSSVRLIRVRETVDYLMTNIVW